MELTATSGADINIEDLLVCENLTVSVTSGADIKVDGVTAKSVTVTSTSGSDADIYSINTNLVTAESTSGSGIFLEGAAKEVDLTANSASNIRASGLRAERGTASAKQCGRYRVQRARTDKDPLVDGPREKSPQLISPAGKGPADVSISMFGLSVSTAFSGQGRPTAHFQVAAKRAWRSRQAAWRARRAGRWRHSSRPCSRLSYGADR